MEARTLAFAIILVLVIAIIGYYVRMRQQDKPVHSKEVYLYFDPARRTPTPDEAAVQAKALGGDVAALELVQAYQQDGGSAPWYGLTASEDIFRIPPSRYSASTLELPFEQAQELGYGIWIYGPKPSPTSPQSAGIAPYSCGTWWQGR